MIGALLIAIAGGSSVPWQNAAFAQEKEPPKVRILLTIGGHGFEEEPFYQMFAAMPGVTYRIANLPRDAALLKPPLRQEVDCLVMYDMVREIPPECQASFLELLRQGIGVVSLHHNLGAHPGWEEFRRIIGGKFMLEPGVIDGRSYAQTPWSHGEHLKIQVVDRDHPITQGVGDFEIHDETYGIFYTAPNIHVLLKTDHPKNNPILAWTTEYAASRVVYLQLGHDRGAYENPNYCKLLYQAILWASGVKP